MIYGHLDTKHEYKEPKGGEHNVPDELSFDEAVKHTLTYIRNDQYPRRGSYFDAGNVKTKIWDVTDIAKEVGKNYNHSHMDDFIFHGALGIPDGRQGREFYNLDWESFCEKTNNFINKFNQQRPLLKLSPWQYDTALELMSGFENGAKIILADLCARFGKTTWAGAIIVETAAPLTIIASYVLTSFASFVKDFSDYEQFRNLALIDSGVPNYKEEINFAITKGKQPVVFLSMYGKESKQDRIDYLFSFSDNTLVFIDEADYGAHTKTQSNPIIAAVKDSDKVILMTGTNSDRAATNWVVDKFLSTSYIELQLAKKEYLNA